VLVANDVGSVASQPASLQLLAQSNSGTPVWSAHDKLGDAVDLSQSAQFRRQDAGGDVRGFSIAQTFSTVGATKEEGEPDPAGQSGGASEWYVYTTPQAGRLHLDTRGSTFNTLLAAYTNSGGSAVTFSSLAEAISGYTTNYVSQGQPSLDLPQVAAEQTFYVVVDGYNGASGQAHLNIGLGVPPAISAPPQSRPAVPGETVVFSVLASGTTNFSYQWQFQGAAIAGATGSSYSVSNAQALAVGAYTVVVSNVVAAVTSAPALLTLQTAPFILLQPENTIAPPGRPASFSVGADGLAPLFYQWYFKNAPLAGENGPTLAWPAVKAANGGPYSVVIRNASGSVTSAPALLTVGTEAKPTVAITTPPNPFHTTHAGLTVKGTAAGQGGITNVQLALNGTPLGSAAGTNAWTATLDLVPGTNLLSATSFDALGIASAPVTHAIFYIVPAPLTLLASGPGQISGESNGALLHLGQGYTVTARPKAFSGCLFSNWLGGDSPGNLTVLSENPVLYFLMSSNLVLQANFGPNPFSNVAGAYHALFPTESSAVTQTNSGSLGLQLSAARGAYSAQMLLGGGRYTLAGSFDLTGNATNLVRRNGQAPLTVVLRLELDAAGPANPLTGWVSTADWLSPLYGERAAFNARTAPATAYAGQYTLLLPPGPGAPDLSPGGYGAATLTNNLAGTALLAGHLGDGTPISQTVPLSQDGHLPVYIPLYAGQGSLWGWLSLSNNPATDPAQTLSGDLGWIKLPSQTRYPGGFASQSSVLASVYRPGAAPWPPANSTLTIAGPGQSSPLVYSNLAVLRGQLVNPNAAPTNKLSLTFTPASGVLTLSFRPTGARTNLTAHGVVLQNGPTHAAGWYLTPAASGSFLLEK